LAASSAGVLRFDASLRNTEQWSTKDGLLSNAVLQVAHWDADGADSRNPQLACATSKGLSLGARGKLHGLTTVQGLPSNSLYAVLVQGRKTYVGTLGGLAVVEDGRVSRVFKDTNSKLTNNWVTALAAVGQRIFVGTYGGGLFELNASGELRSFAPELGRVVVNPNAMWTDGLRLFVGTLDGAFVFEPSSQQWTRVKSELPSRTVLSITGSDNYVYFGTTGGIARIERSYWNRLVSEVSSQLGPGQYHLAVAGGCAAFRRCSDKLATRLRTHPLPRGGTDPVQQRLQIIAGRAVVR
jgi:ligand-binding sensor domain-containing protein